MYIYIYIIKYSSKIKIYPSRIIQNNINESTFYLITIILFRAYIVASS